MELNKVLPGIIRSGKLFEFLICSLVIVVIGVLFATPVYPLALLPAFFVLFLFLLWRWPQFGLYGIIFLVPFSAYSDLTRYLTLTQIVGILLVIILTLQLLLNKSEFRLLKSNLWKWLFFFFIISLFSSLLSEYPQTSFTNIYYILIAYTILALVLILLTEHGFRKTLPWVIVASTSIGAVLLVIGYIFKLQLFAIGEVGKLRGTGTAGDPNDFSSMLIFGLPILFHLVAQTKTTPKKIFMVALLVLHLISIVLTYSRGGAIVVTIVFGAIAFQYLKKLLRRPKLIGFGAAIAALALLGTMLMVPGAYWERQTSLIKKGTFVTDASLAARASLVMFGKDAFLQNPVIGSGPGTFRDKYAVESEYRYWYDFDPEEEGREAAHNVYLEFLVGQGLLGFLFFCGCLLAAIKSFNMALQRTRERNLHELASLVYAYRLAFFSQLLFFFILSIQYSKYFWLALALSQISLRLAQETKEVEEKNIAVISPDNDFAEIQGGTPLVSFR